MSLPLSGIRILDLSRLLPGAYASQMMADFGADVIKVEEPESGDYGRFMPPHGPDGMSLYFTAINRNKRSITLNLKKEEGRDVFLRLVRDADVVLESFRPGVMDRLGLGYEQLKEVQPGIIVDMGRDDRIIGVEILRFVRRFARRAKKLASCERTAFKFTGARMPSAKIGKRRVRHVGKIGRRRYGYLGQLWPGSQTRPQMNHR